MEKETMSKDNMDDAPGSSNKSPPRVGYHQRGASMDSTGGHHYSHQQHHHHYSKGSHMPLPPPHQQQQNFQNSQSKGGYAYPPPHHHAGYHHPHYPPPPRSAHPMVRSVVTHSFSMEEEREDGSSRYGGGHRHDPTYPREEYRSPPVEPHDRSASHGGQPSGHREDDIHQHQQQQHHHAFDPPPPVPAYNNSQRGEGPSHYGGRDHLGPLAQQEDDARMPPHDATRAGGGHSPSVRIPPSPREQQQQLQPPSVQRSHSAGAPLPPGSFRIGGGQVAVSPAGPLKRSFWHHSRPATGGEEFEGSLLPQEFMPPKRSKVNGPQGPSAATRGSRDYVVTARPHSSDPVYDERGGLRLSASEAVHSPSGGAWFNRAASWEAREEYYRRDPRSAAASWSSRSPPSRDGPMGGGGPHWAEAPYMPSPRSRYPSDPASGNPFDVPPHQAWGSPRGGGAGEGLGADGYHFATPPGGGGHLWGHGASQNRDEHESRHGSSREGQEREGYSGGAAGLGGHFESMGVDGNHHHGSVHFTIRGMHTMGAPKPPPPDMMNSGGGASNNHHHHHKVGPVKLLALPEDRISLSETLCLVRENIEVFTATVEDVEAPAPGRKHAVSVGQVGLRCIHCRHTTRSSERVKRAVCYPSSIKRIYRTVIDMKLDHFLHCKFVPHNLKDTLAALKVNNTRSTGTTMQYFIRAATTLGMVDGPSGVRIDDSSSPGGNATSSAMASSPQPVQSSATGSPQLMTPSSSDGGATAVKASIEPRNSSDHSDKSETLLGDSDFRIHRTGSMSSEGTGNTSVIMDDSSVPTELFTGKVPLSLPEDKMSLSPLRCFLREQVCAFSATDEDIAVRTPTTFAVSVGQVGIGCVHCMSQPAKLRLNRAVCFPFSIARIYQSVADIQRFHLSECKMVPAEAKEKFMELQSQSSKGSKGLATRQYWVTSAKKIGLVDTAKGIRFGRDPAVPEQKSVSLDILAQVASNVTTVNRPLVIPEDKPYIAEFLYVVMEQLQPCRFTEADRNKRRLKDVGCIGVECKHCAGQVDSRKFFWSSVNAVESNFVSVHTHMVECRMVPDQLKDHLGELKKLRKEQTAALKTGSQKSFFARVWKRLHGDAEQQQRELEKQEMEASAKEQGEGGTEPEEGLGQEDETSHDQQILKTELKREEVEPLNDAEIIFCRELPDSPMQMTPTTSPASVEKPMAEINLGASPASPDASENIKDVSDQMAIVTV